MERFIREAADDPQTVSIKMTVYRVGDDTPFVQSLIRAAESGKQVACVIELNARFDEARNLHWSRELEKVGAHVMFGVLRPEDAQQGGARRPQRGGRHALATRTSRPATTTPGRPGCTRMSACSRPIRRSRGDVVNLFHFLTGRSRTPSFPTLLVAPMDMRARFVELVEREIENHHAGPSGSDRLQDEPARGR